MATYYCNADIGDDGTGDGSSGNPWLLLQTAYTAASNGDTIVLQDSIASFTISGSLTIAKDLTIQGEQDDGSGAVFDRLGFAVANNKGLFYCGNAKTITLEKFTVKDGSCYQSASGLGGCFMMYEPNTTLNINKVVVNGWDVWGYYHLAGLVTFINGGVAAPSTVNITDCLFYNLFTSQNSITPNWDNWGVFTNRDGGSTINLTGTTVYMKPSHTVQATANIIKMDAGSSTVKNCIFVDPDGVIDYKGGTVTTTYSCGYNFVSAPTGTGVITTDPLFVDPANFNFKLRSSSPCKDTGTL